MSVHNSLQPILWPPITPVVTRNDTTTSQESNEIVLQATNEIFAELTQIELPRMELLDLSNSINFAVNNALDFIFLDDQQDLDLSSELVEQILIQTIRELDEEEQSDFCVSLLIKLKERMDQSDKSLIIKAALDKQITGLDLYKIFHAFSIFSRAINLQVSESISKILLSLSNFEENPLSLNQKITQRAQELLAKMTT